MSVGGERGKPLPSVDLLAGGLDNDVVSRGTDGAPVNTYRQWGCVTFSLLDYEMKVNGFTFISNTGNTSHSCCVEPLHSHKGLKVPVLKLPDLKLAAHTTRSNGSAL